MLTAKHITLICRAAWFTIHIVVPLFTLTRYIRTMNTLVQNCLDCNLTLRLNLILVLF